MFATWSRIFIALSYSPQAINAVAVRQFRANSAQNVVQKNLTVLGNAVAVQKTQVNSVQSAVQKNLITLLSNAINAVGFRQIRKIRRNSALNVEMFLMTAIKTNLGDYYGNND